MSKIISFVQNLSIDITIGALISCAFIAQLMEVDLTLSMYLGLAIAIWLIYTLDHLIDADKSQQKPLNPRHAFHFLHRKKIITFASLVFLLGVVNLFYLPLSTLLLGTLLAFLACLYFLYLKYRKKQEYKEYLAAFVYSSGIMVAPVSQLNAFTYESFYLFLIFFLLAFANLILIPLYEVKLDENDAHPSMPINKGIKATENKIRITLFSTYLVMAAYGFTYGLSFIDLLVFVLMPLTLVVLMFGRQTFARFSMYRIFADGIFFIPGLSLVFQSEYLL